MKRLSFFISAALCTFLACYQSAGAIAQQIDQAKIHNFIHSAEHRALIHQALSAIPKSILQVCPTLASKEDHFIPLSMITFGTDGSPASGKWMERLPVTGCGADITLNFIFEVDQKGMINTVIGVVGDTHANIILQKDAIKYANVAVATVDNACNKFDVKNTRFTGYADPTAAGKKSWKETWTMTGCEHDHDVLLDFIPNETGTQIVAHPIK